MRSHFGMAWIALAFGAALACSSSSSPPSVAAEAGPAECTDTIVNVFNDNNNVACPIDDSGHPVTYNEAITNTCANENLMTGDVAYGQCFEFLVFEVDVDASGANGTKCFYDVSSHALVGLIFGDGMQDQCGGTSSTVAAGSVDLTCTITGLNGGGSGFQSCTPVQDAGEESMLLGQTP
jgi:hypothetical protein